MKNYVRIISLCLGFASLIFAQTTTAPIYNMSILAGIPAGNGLGDNGPSTNGVVSSPEGIAVDPNGNIFIADNNNSRIRRIDGTTGIITTFATTTAACYVGTLTPTATTNGDTTTNGSCLNTPIALAFDSKGDLLVTSNNPNGGYIIRINPAATSIQVLSGTNVSGTYNADGQYAFDSVLDSVAGIATDANDNIYYTDNGTNRVKMIKNVNNCMFTAGFHVDPRGATGFAGANPIIGTTCKVYTIAGNNNIIAPQVGTSGTALSASACGNTSNTCTPAGTNTVGDGGPALTARVNGPWGIAVTPDGSMVYVAQNGDHRIRAINMLTGIISTVIGNCTSATSSSNNVGGGNPTVIPCPSGSYGSASASANGDNTLGDGKLASQGTLNSPRGLFLDRVNNVLYVADGSNNRIRAINLGTGIVTSVVGGGSTTGDVASGLNSGLLTSLSLSTPYAVWVQNGLIYFVEQGNNKVRVADPVGQLAKNLVGQPKSTGSGGPATQTYLGFAAALTSSASPRVAVDNSGNVYAVEASTNRIRKITSDGIIHDWAGTGVSGFIGDTNLAVVARLSSPQQLSFDSAGNGYIADAGNNRIRKVDTNGIITTVVGRGSQVTTCSVANSANGTCTVDKSNYVGDGGPPANCLLSAPQGVTVDALGNLIIADTGHNSIRYADLTNNVIWTIAGGVPATSPTGAKVPNGPTDGRSGLGTSGDLDSTNALYGFLSSPRGVAVDKNGNIYIADWGNSVARELIPTNTTTLAYSLFGYYGSGSGSNTSPNIPTGTGLPSVPARIRINGSSQTSVDVDTGGNIYHAVGNDGEVKVVTADHGAVYIVCGNTNNSYVGLNDTGLIYTSGNAVNTQCPQATGVAVAKDGTVYVADRAGVIRKLVCTKNCLPLK